MSDYPAPGSMSPGFVAAPAMSQTKSVVVAINGMQLFRFDPEFPNSTSTVSIDPDQAQMVENILGAALDKAKALTVAFKSLSGS